MPTYDYRCPNGHDFEHFYRKISESTAELECPTCGAIAVRRVSGGAGLVFKGSGFYLTDYGKNAHRGTAPESTKGDGQRDSKGESKGDAGGGEGKAEGRSESAKSDAGKSEPAKSGSAKSDAAPSSSASQGASSSSSAKADGGKGGDSKPSSSKGKGGDAQ